ncbi:MAG: 50S ribosomal protein L15 [Acidobacteria bacterium]|nr:50S ribosomal protein L15 [Acidobacteriota bacterium]
MSLNNLKPPKGAKRNRKRVGRGEGSGTGVTSGRGHKGQQSRSGYARKRGFEGGQMPVHRRLPKRGFHNPFRVAYEVVNLDTLEERFESGAEVTPEALRTLRLVSRHGLVKVLARGEITKSLTVKAHRFSAKARESIAGAGGHCEVVSSRRSGRKESA